MGSEIVMMHGKVLVTIIDKDEQAKLEDVLLEKQVRFHYMFSGQGTARSEVLKAFGLSGTAKTVCLCLVRAIKASALMTAITERMELIRPGKGIAYILPISAFSSSIARTFLKDKEEHTERSEDMSTVNEPEQPVASVHYEMVVAIVNQGFSEEVMEAAREAGVRGGTIIKARRSGLADAVKFFGISLQEEKEVVAMVISRDQKKTVMQSISAACGMRTAAHGIVIAVPVEDCSGIDFPKVEPANGN